MSTMSTVDTGVLGAFTQDEKERLFLLMKDWSNQQTIIDAARAVIQESVKAFTDDMNQDEKRITVSQVNKLKKWFHEGEQKAEEDVAQVNDLEALLTEVINVGNNM